MSERVLIVEDEVNIATPVRMYLERAGFEVSHSETATDAIGAFERHGADLIVLDLNLPDGDGIEVCRAIRASSSVPIIMVTARDEDVDKIVGLELGADDYLAKPFNVRELVARVKAILRRVNASVGDGPGGTLTHGSLAIDHDRHVVTVDGAEVKLAPKEFDLLWALLAERGKVMSRERLLEQVWGYTFAGDTRTVDVHVRQVRRKLGDACPIVTVWGVGYKVADVPIG